MKEILSARELERLIDLVSEKTEASDFEYQDEEYQEFFNRLELKLIRFYNSELVRLKDVREMFNDVANGRD